MLGGTRLAVIVILLAGRPLPPATRQHPQNPCQLRVTYVATGNSGDMRYGVLGPLSVEASDGPVTLHSTQQRLLLSRLLVAGGGSVSSDRIAETLWPDALPTDPFGAVRTQVSRLRARLGTQAIETVEGSYRLALRSAGD